MPRRFRSYRSWLRTQAGTTNDLTPDQFRGFDSHPSPPNLFAQLPLVCLLLHPGCSHKWEVTQSLFCLAETKSEVAHVVLLNLSGMRVLTELIDGSEPSNQVGLWTTEVRL